MEDEDVIVQEDVVEAEVQETDWKAEAEKAKEQISNLNKALHESRKLKVPADIDSVIEQKLQEIEQKRMADDMEEIAKTIGGDKASELIETYKNELKPSGFSRAAMERDLRKAQLLVDKDRLLADAEKKARKSYAEKSAMTNASVSVTSAPEEKDEAEYTAEERQFLSKMANYAK